MELLKQLQGMDSEILQKQESRRKYEDELAQLKSECDKVQIMVDSLIEEMSGLEQEKHQLQLDQQRERDRIDQTESRLPQIKTQREYLAVLKEVDAAKKDHREVELAIAARDESLGALASDREEKEQRLAELSAAWQARSAELEDEMNELATALEGQTKERQRLLKQLPAGLGKRYQMLIQRRKGLAVVGARGGACLGCNMHLPPQVFNSLFRMTEIQLCPHCNRILYLAEEQG